MFFGLPRRKVSSNDNSLVHRSGTCNRRFVLILLIFSKNSFFCPSQQKWFAGPYKTIPEERPGGKYMLEQLDYEWSQSFHIEFEFNWTEPSPHWQAVFHVTGPTQNNDHRVPTIYQYPGTTLSFGIYLLARHVRSMKSKSFDVLKHRRFDSGMDD